MTWDLDDAPAPGIRPDGTPDPQYAASLGIVQAGAGRRSAAFAIDAAVWAVLSVPAVLGFVALFPAALALQAGEAPDVAALTLPFVLVAIGLGLTTVFGLAQLILHGRLGLTIGKAAVGVRSVNVATLNRPGFWRVVLRVLVLYASQLVLPIVGPAVLFASSLWQPRGRSWLDLVGRTWAIDVRRGLNPFDPRALRQAVRAINAPAPATRADLPSLASGAQPDAFAPGPRSSRSVVGSPAGDAPQWDPPSLAPQQPATVPQPAAPGVESQPPAPATHPVPASAAPVAPAAPPPAPPAAPAPAAPAAVRVAVLTFDDGSTRRVGEAALIGRNPSGSTGEASAHLIPLTDPSMMISKTHAACGVDADGFWVADRGSTNGTDVRQGDDWHRLPADERVRVPWGTTVRVGGRTFRIDPGEGGA